MSLADWGNTVWPIDWQRVGASALALTLLWQPAFAQDRSADAELKDLIPDSAVQNPESWAQGTQPTPAVETSLPSLDIDAPLANIPEMTVQWPEKLDDLPEMAELEPDPETAAELAELVADDDQPARRQGETHQLPHNLSLTYRGRTRDFPERDAFEERFRELSAIETLSDKKDENVAQLAVRAKTDRQLLIRLLRIYGYYDSDVTQTVTPPKEGEKESEGSVNFDIYAGKRYSFGVIDLGGLNETLPDYATLRESFIVKTGDPLYSDVIVTGKTNLTVALGEHGYAFAKVGEPDLLVDHLRDEGDLTLPVAPGGQYVFGQVVSNLPDFLSSKHLQTIARFDPGNGYKRSEVDDLRRAILATGLVSRVSLTPRETRAPSVGQPGEVAVDVDMSKAPLRTIAGAVGYDSSDGFRLEASWEHRNMFPPEGMFRARGILGSKEQLAGLTFRRNNFGGRDQVLTVDLYGSLIARDAYDARTVALTTTYEKLTTLIFQKQWVWSAGLELLATNEREGDVNNVSTQRDMYYVMALPLRGAYDSSDNLFDPTHGFRVALRASPEISFLHGNQSTYARLQFDASYYQPVGDRVIVAGRTRLGSIPGTAIENIAPSRRFYAGGGGSVRGYGYQEIGPRDSLGDPSGGRSLTEFSLEARVKTGFFGGALSVVPFIDAGTVDESVTPGVKNMQYGAGIGVRYKTNFGPVRVDVGTPLNPRPGDSRIGVYVSLGQAF